MRRDGEQRFLARSPRTWSIGDWDEQDAPLAPPRDFQCVAYPADHYEVRRRTGRNEPHLRVPGPDGEDLWIAKSQIDAAFKAADE